MIKFIHLLYLFASLAGVAFASLPGLAARQNTLSNIPPGCTDKCNVLNTLQANTDIGQLCTDANSADLQSCANCILLIGGNSLLNNDSLMSSTQRAVNSFTSACSSASLPVNNILIQDPTTQTTATTTATGTGSASSPSHSSLGFKLRNEMALYGNAPIVGAALFGLAISWI